MTISLTQTQAIERTLNRLGTDLPDEVKQARADRLAVKHALDSAPTLEEAFAAGIDGMSKGTDKARAAARDTYLQAFAASETRRTATARLLAAAEQRVSDAMAANGTAVIEAVRSTEQVQGWLAALCEDAAKVPAVSPDSMLSQPAPAIQAFVRCREALQQLGAIRGALQPLYPATDHTGPEAALLTFHKAPETFADKAAFVAYLEALTGTKGTPAMSSTPGVQVPAVSLLASAGVTDWEFLTPREFATQTARIRKLRGASAWPGYDEPKPARAGGARRIIRL